jgi:hypothetical protein
MIQYKANSSIEKNVSMIWAFMGFVIFLLVVLLLGWLTQIL